MQDRSATLARQLGSEQGDRQPEGTREASRQPEWTRCDACGSGMQSLGHCKWLCRRCGFMRTCIDTV